MEREKAIKKAVDIIIDSEQVRQSWLVGYSKTKMVVVPVDVLKALIKGE